MKTKLSLSTLLLSAVLLSACNNNKSTTQEPAPVDSVKLKDSLAKVEIKRADENKVIGDIKFGISEKAFEKKSASFTNSLKKDAFGVHYLIGDYCFSRIDGEFDENMLYSAYLTGDFMHYKEYNAKLIDQVAILNNMLTQKYGAPVRGKGAPAWNNTEKGYSYLAYLWEVGNKSVEIKVTNHGLYYSTDMKIYQPFIEKAIKDREDKKDMITASEAKDVL